MPKPLATRGGVGRLLRFSVLVGARRGCGRSKRAAGR